MSPLSLDLVNAFARRQCNSCEPISQFSLPRELSSSAEFDTAVAELGREGLTLSQGNVHTLTLEGWLVSELGTRVALVIEGALAMYREQTQAAVARPKVDWESLRSRAGFGATDVHFALWVLRASKVVGMTSLRQNDFSATAPHEYQRWLRIHSFAEFLQQYRREEREELAAGGVLSREQRTACQQTYRVFLENEAWPSVQALEILLDERSVDLSKVVRGHSLMRAGDCEPNETSYITLYGLIILDEAQEDVSGIIGILRILAKRYACDVSRMKHPALEICTDAGLDGQDRMQRLLRILAVQGDPFVVENADDLNRAYLGTSRAFRGCRELTGIRTLVAWLAKVWPFGPPVVGASAAMSLDPTDDELAGLLDVQTADGAKTAHTGRGRASSHAAPGKIRMTTDDLLTRLSHLLPSQFEEVLFRAKVPTAHLPGPSAPQASRAIDALRYLKQVHQLDQLAQILDEVAGHS